MPLPPRRPLTPKRYSPATTTIGGKVMRSWEQVLIQPFGKQYVMIKEEETIKNTIRNDDTEEHDRCGTSGSGKTFFSIYEISDLNDIRCYPLFELDQKDLHFSSSSSNTERGIPNALENVRIDWETSLLGNNSSSNKNECRAFAEMSKAVSKNRHVFEKCTLKDFPTLIEKDVPEKTCEDYGFVCFVGGRALFIESHTGYSVPKIEIVNASSSQGKEMMLEPLRGFQIPYTENPNDGTVPKRFEKSYHLIVPCENIKETKHALNAILFGGMVYRYDLSRREFDISSPIAFRDETWTRGFSFKTDVKARFFPYLENGTRLRSFVLQNGKLFEFIWIHHEENILSIAVIQHLEWLTTDISNILRCDSIGLLIQTKDKCLLYQPEPFSQNSLFSKSQGKIYTLKTIDSHTPLFWSETSKCISTFVHDDQTQQATHSSLFVPLLSWNEIEKLPYQLVKDIFDEQAFKSDLEFSTFEQEMKPKMVNLELLEKVTDLEENFGKHFRIACGYQCPLDKYNEMEIIAGIGCLRMKDQLGEALSPNYIELQPEEFSQYLGAPIMYNEWLNNDRINRMCYRYFITDMKHCIKSSGIIKIANAERGSFGTSSIDLLEIYENPKIFIGILIPKINAMDNKDDATAIESQENSQKLALCEKQRQEFETLCSQQLFQVESKSLKVCDPLIDPSGALIENVKPGVWKWIQYSPSTDNEREQEMNPQKEMNKEDEESHSENEMSLTEPFEHMNYDYSLVHQLAVIHQDFVDSLLTSNPEQFWKVPKSIFQEEEHEQDENSLIEETDSLKPSDFKPQEHEGGWYLMTCGIDVDTGMAGIYDAHYFNKESVLKDFNLVNSRKLSTLEQHFSFKTENDWQSYVIECAEKRSHGNYIPVPFGIISSSGYGDGCYACLFKRDSVSQQVVAVRVIFIAHEFESQGNDNQDNDGMNEMEPESAAEFSTSEHSEMQESEDEEEEVE
nr:unnamed protein product [Naegleria fowleri]